MSEQCIVNFFFSLQEAQLSALESMEAETLDSETFLFQDHLHWIILAQT